MHLRAFFVPARARCAYWHIFKNRGIIANFVFFNALFWLFLAFFDYYRAFLLFCHIDAQNFARFVS
ncbi:hypothetical protein BKN38_05485 [Helicobacter sp. CLO-3]|nr:hypothetical protein BA723_05995 [Helicobacter sp. CLO-3]OHU83340.1 hypothetical protein BKN38_05485 [Helicobacter sp. CLO-3]